MMKFRPKLIAGAGSFIVAAGVSAVLVGTSGYTSAHVAAARPASHQRVAIGATGATAIGLTLVVKAAPVRIAVQPLKVTVTSTTRPKPAKVTRSGTDPTCPGMGGAGGYDPTKHHSVGKPGGH